MAVATAGGVPAGAPVARIPGAERIAPTGCAARRRHVHGPWVDFLTLGGGSLFVLAALAAFYPSLDFQRTKIVCTLRFRRTAV